MKFTPVKNVANSPVLRQFESEGERTNDFCDSERSVSQGIQLWRWVVYQEVVCVKPHQATLDNGISFISM